ncbi:class I SAM-dependent methyltransferase [Paenibacillus sonchi]|uniref:class I SAM-dependent methyltransferase n=1 Tax=Paenibacillus sonchi TaxID=373687 RepID=UPI001E59871C|nr:methyltransferase domain-containing protein [Paenibacillus sonchi]MCE3201047.1 methyltransferase domain-containing protein [Paenibacillus sonchi]
MGRDTQSIKRRYDRMAPLFHRMDGKMMTSWRRELLSGLSGDVLEVGIGTGANLSFYPPAVRLTGIDFSPKMLQYAEQSAKELDIILHQHVVYYENNFGYQVQEL